jgi:hypothetical protein
MATQVFISCDTELSALLYQRGASARANYDASITGRTTAGDYGIGWQMDRLEEHGLKGVFFVDPMPALVHGRQIVTDIVGPILSRGHEVQLHVHTEWLDFAPTNPFAPLSGHSIADFPADTQKVILALARDLLVDGGAPTPMAFRAGNYGADDNTLHSLAGLGINWDTSLNPVYLGSECRISLPHETINATPHCGVTELPVSTLYDRPGHLRPAQVCALSSREMFALLDHAARTKQAHVMIVCHSFEMLSRDRQRPNRLVMDRYEALCARVSQLAALESSVFSDVKPVETGPAAHLPPNLLRTGWRYVEQAWAQARYERA